MNTARKWIGIEFNEEKKTIFYFMKTEVKLE